MKKNTKILIIVCAAALILAGLMCLLIFLPKGDGSSSGAATYDEGVKMSVTTDKDGVHQAQIQTNDKGEIDNNSYGTLMDYIPAKISKIHLENKKGTLDIKSYTPTDKNGKTSATQYTIVGYEDFDLQGGIADNIANNAASIDFTKVMTLDGSKLADYGLDKPRDTVTVTYTDKTKAIIYVGDDAPQNAGTYIKFGSNDTVYLVAKDSVSAFDYGLTDLISLTINDAASDNDNSQASSIEISGSNFSNTITLKPNSDNKNSASYVMTSPVECYANEKESSLVAGGIRGLYAICSAIFLLYAVVISFFATPEWSVILCTFIGLLLFGAALLAINIFISSLTESTIVAAIVSMAVNLVIYMMTNFTSMISIDWIKNIIEKIDFATYYNSFKYGLLSAPDIVFFLSVAGLFVFFTVRVLEKRRWS